MRPAHQRGQAIVLIAIMLAVVVGMAALAIDGSRAYALRRDLQAAVDSAALSAGDRLQQTGSFTSAELAASTIFGTNLRLYAAPSCSPGYSTPGASSVTVTCTYSDGTVLTQVVSALGPQGTRFSLTATRSLPLQFARILTNGGSPTISAASQGSVGNLLYAPAVGALDQAGCGGAGGTSLTIAGTGTMNVDGDVVASGAISVSSALRVAGDIYARCQSAVPGSVTNACYPSGASTPCTYPDVAGATRSGYRLVDPNYPAPVVVGGSQPAPGTTVALQAGTYAANPTFNGGDCWFLGGGVYDWQGGYSNTADFVSNELKPPDEPALSGGPMSVSSNQFWDTNGVNCAGAFQVNNIGGTPALDDGNWGFVLTSVRNDFYNGTSYRRESAPSACRFVHVHTGEVVQIQVSNVPGATSYNVYAGTFGNGCIGPWGYAGSIPVVGTVSNSNTNPCPLFTGAGCSLGHETAIFDNTLLPDTFAPNPAASPQTFEAYPPDPETAPLTASLPNQNPARGSAAAGDRANENNCMTAATTYAGCPSGVTPGAVVFYLPSGACYSNTTSGDSFVFSGYQYDWLSVYEPGKGSPPANTCANSFGAAGNSAYIGLVYAPAASLNVTSAAVFESPATGGLIADTLSFSGTLPAIVYSAAYAPIPPASRLTG